MRSTTSIWAPCLALVALLALEGAASPLRAQGGGQGPQQLRAASVQPLSFGVVFPGQAEVVRVTDAGRRGVVTLEGQGQVQLSMILPGEMLSMESHRIPLTFGYGAGGYAASATAEPVLFDPAQAQRIMLTGGNQQAWIYLGGTASVSPDQPPGSYSATVVVTVTQPNT